MHAHVVTQITLRAVGADQAVIANPIARRVDVDLVPALAQRPTDRGDRVLDPTEFGKEIIGKHRDSHRPDLRSINPIAPAPARHKQNVKKTTWSSKNGYRSPAK